MFHLGIRLFITAEKELSPVRCLQSDRSAERLCHCHYPITILIVNGNIYAGMMVQPHAYLEDDCGNGSHYSSRQSIINQTETVAYLSFWTATEHVFLQKHRPYA